MPNKPDMDAARRLVCEFMEPMPETVPDDAEDMDLAGACVHSPLGFWLCVGGYVIAYAWEPCPLTLDHLHLVEERLTPEQQCRYLAALFWLMSDDLWNITTAFSMIHATADQKVMALAKVVEGK